VRAPHIPSTNEQRVAVTQRLGAAYLARFDALRAEILRERQRVELANRQLATEADFARLTALHRTSFKTADAAYDHLRAARGALDQIGQSIGTAKLERTQLVKSNRSIDMVRATLDHLHRDREAITAFRESFRSEVDVLNLQTRQLKLRIRDSCGRQGCKWYQDLETRIAEKRSEA
jgi:hypothetical protein